MSSKKIEVPFDENGKLIPIVIEKSRWHQGTPVAEWRDNFKFDGVFQFVGINKGAYSDQMIFERAESGEHVNMHMNDFVKVVPHLHYGALIGTFTYARSHGKYGIRFLP